MRIAPGLTMMILAGSLASAGCDALGPEEKLGEFTWQELAGAPITEQVEIVKVGSEILFLGQLNTPTACYRIEPLFDDNGTSVTMHIRVLENIRTGCGDRESAYRYNGLLRRVGAAREMRIIHQIENVGSTEFVRNFDEDD